MMLKHVVKSAGFVVLAGALLVSGCARKGKQKTAAGDGTDGIIDDTTTVMGDSTLAERPGEFGTKVSETFENVGFQYDSYQIDTAEVPKVEAVASFMKSNADVRLVADGHCDERGSREYNMALGEHRAQAVRAYLISLGVEGERIQTRSFGEENPLDPSQGDAAWAANRRVEFGLYR